MYRASAVRVAAVYLSPQHMAIRVAESFEDAVKGRKFRNPETGNQVTFKSLPSREQEKLRSKWKQTQEAEDMSADAEEDVEDLSDDAEEDVEEKPKEKPAKDSPKKSWKSNLKDLGDKAKKFLTDAPADIQKFVNDPKARKKALGDVTSALKKAPQKYAKSLVETAKHEVKEFKEAGEGIKAVLKGGKMSDHQKKALKTVSMHVALGVTAAVLTASGPLAAAGAFGKGLAKYVAMKAATRSLGNIHVLQELGHVGHGIESLLHHLASEKKEPNVDEVLGNYVTAMVVKELEGLTDEDVHKVLKDMG